MTRRYLFGPVPAAFADQSLFRLRQSGDCLAFNATGGADLTVAGTDSWEVVCARLPPGWRPDFVALNLAYETVPAALWEAPLPVVGLAADWNLLWHHYRRCLSRCDLVLTDAPGVAALARQGLAHARAANLFGLDRAFLENPPPDGPRDIDVLFVGNLHPDVQRERLPWLGRLAALGDRFNVVLAAGVFGDAYRRLLARARVVFNRSIRGECNRRAFEAAACGALLFQEAGNAEVPRYFHDRRECVCYTDANLEELLAHYLGREAERRAVAEAGRAQALTCGFADLWQQEALEAVEADWPGLVGRVGARPQRAAEEALLDRLWQAVSAETVGDAALAGDLESHLAGGRDRAGLRYALGVASALPAPPPGGAWPAGALAKAERHFRAAAAADPADPLARLAVAECLFVTGPPAACVDELRQVLQLLDRPETPAAGIPDAPPFPPGFTALRVEWERAAWAHAGDADAEARAKVNLLRWRAHVILADLTGEERHFNEAALSRPDLPRTRAALGCARARAGVFAEAVTHLRRAVEGNPFDRVTARALFQALGDAGDHAGQQALAAGRRRLARAAPRAVPSEPWFAEPTVAFAGKTADSPTDPTRFQSLTLDEFHRLYGDPDTARAIYSFTPPGDTHIVLTLLAHARPRRVLEVGTAGGHMTANLTEWTPDDATVFSLGVVADLAVPTAAPQRYEDPPRGEFGRFANHFGKAHKVLFATADSLAYDFGRLGPLDFAFLDGAHDAAHVLSDTLKVYKELAPGGCLVWHDFDSPVAWVEVRRALEATDFAEAVYHVTGTKVAFLHKRAGARAPSVRGAGVAERAAPAAVVADDSRLLTPSGAAPARPPVRRRPLAVTWEGAQEEVQSLALVNRQLCTQLIERGHDLSILPLDFAPEMGVSRQPAPPALATRFRAPLGRPCEAHVRHFWPPSFEPPPAGHWVLMQPWEYGSLPRAWVGPVTEWVDEVWAYTQAVRDCYVQSGVPADRVHVIPLGVDVSRFHPGAAPRTLAARRRFRFLFVGGTIRRKGFDVLLAAYAREFTAADDVCLVVKDMGAGSFYRGQTAEGDIARLRDRPGAPAVEYIDRPLSEEELAGLYTACDCLVLPYRGEGFGLPIAEAMACGLPVVVTGRGAASDFCDESRAYLIPAGVSFFPENRVGDLDTVGRPWLAEPDGEALAAALRHVAAHPEEAKAKGAAGSAFVRAHLTWDHAAAAVERRLEALRDRPVRRLAGANGATAPRRRRVSLCMIVKNEEENLPACLASAADLVDEVIVVDTGSADRTRELARRAGAKVVDFPWRDSFAAARNESLRHATGDWVFWMDADDRLDEENRARLRALFARLGDERDCYVMKCRCLPDASGAVTVVDHVRLFRNHPEVRWRYRVHEQILPAVRRFGGQPRWSDVAIDHTGYQDPALRRRKLDRDLRLLLLERAEQPDDPFTLFNLGSVYQELGRVDEAAGLFRRSLERSAPTDSIVRKLYALLAHCQRQLGRTAEALATCREGLAVCPGDAELLFREGLALHALGDHAGGIARLEELRRTPPGDYFASVDAGLRGHLALHNLAVMYAASGDAAAAERHWQEALAARPDYVPAWEGLGQLYLGQRRWRATQQAANHLEALPAGALAGLCLCGRVALARKKFRGAVALLREARGRYPRALEPAVLLSHALLQQGRDWGAAEAALWDVLRLDPEQQEARRNLVLLLRQRGRPEAAVDVERRVLDRLYREACATPSDVHEHCPTLYRLARECEHVTVLGGRGGAAAAAFLCAQPARLVCYDPQPSPAAGRLAPFAGRTRLEVRAEDGLGAQVEETDLLYVDTVHAYGRLREELRRHAGRARRYVVVPQTTTCAAYGEVPGEAGLWPAVDEFLGTGTFRLKERYENNNGLTVLERAANPDNEGEPLH